MPGYFSAALTSDWTQQPPAHSRCPPDAAMQDALERDYAAMSGMIFGEIPPLDEVLASVALLQEAINA